MKGLTTLIKLQKRKTDELRKRLAVLNERKDGMLAQSAALQKQLEAEIALAGKLAGLGNFFGDFSKRIKQQRTRIAQDIKQLDRKIDALASEIQEAFSEQKKYEITLEQRKLREKQRQKRLEQNKMDDIAIRQHGEK